MVGLGASARARVVMPEMAADRGVRAGSVLPRSRRSSRGCGGAARVRRGRRDRAPAAAALEPVETLLKIQACRRSSRRRRVGSAIYAVNPGCGSTSTLAQIAHAAVMADALGLDVSRARVIVPERWEGLDGGVAEVRDAGLTEVPPGTVNCGRVLNVTADARLRLRQLRPDPSRSAGGHRGRQRRPRHVLRRRRVDRPAARPLRARVRHRATSSRCSTGRARTSSGCARCCGRGRASCAPRPPT